MELLPNGCWCSDLTVNPSNWLDGGVGLLKKDWFIQYYFHDPDFKQHPKYSRGKFCVVKGMNRKKDLQGRRGLTAMLIQEELDNLKAGFNPITKAQPKPAAPIKPATEGGPLPTTPVKEALQMASKSVKVEERTRRDIGNILTYVNKSAEALHLSVTPVSEIKKRHIRMILDNCANLTRLDGEKKKWTANQFNHYKKYLSILFSELEEWGATDDNPVAGIKKQKGIKTLKVLLSREERLHIDKYLQEKFYNFWRFLHIFFHSGSRETEMMRLQVKHVNLKDQTFKVIVLKGKSPSEALRPIKNEALFLWQEVMKDCEAEDYIFSRGLKPGVQMIRSDQITKRWYRLIKKPMGIKANFYVLKNINLDDIARILSIQHSSVAAGHTTTGTTKIYTFGEADREMDRIRKVDNKFA